MGDPPSEVRPTRTQIAMSNSTEAEVVAELRRLNPWSDMQWPEKCRAAAALIESQRATIERVEREKADLRRHLAWAVENLHMIGEQSDEAEAIRQALAQPSTQENDNGR